MSIQKGKTFLLKIGAVSSSPTTVAAVRNLTMTKNGEAVDVSNKDSSSWREVLEAAGINSLSISCDGLFNDGDSQDTLRGYWLSDTVNIFSLFFPNGDTLECPFYIENFETRGGYNDAQEFSMTLQSAGVPTYVQN